MSYAFTGKRNFFDPRGRVYRPLDLIDLLICFGITAPPGFPCSENDVNGDGTVNVLDLINLLLAFGTACP